MSVNDQYALNWSNHTNHIRKAFDSLLAGSEFVDVTLSCEGKKIGAHKMLLSACSTYFHDLFRENPCQHPIVILKDVKFQNLVDILKFMYNGEVSVATENFDSFLKTAELLQVSGLTDDENKYSGMDKDDDAQESSQASVSEQSEQTSIRPVPKRTSFEKPKDKEVTKKRVTNASAEEGTSQKRRKESELHPNVEIKQEEADVVSLEDDHLEVQDPLELEHQNDSAEGMDLLQPAEKAKLELKSETGQDSGTGELLDDTTAGLLGYIVSNNNQFTTIEGKHILVESCEKTKDNRRKRRRCIGCYEQLYRTIGDSKEASKKTKLVRTYCDKCPTRPYMCLVCFQSKH